MEIEDKMKQPPQVEEGASAEEKDALIENILESGSSMYYGEDVADSQGTPGKARSMKEMIEDRKKAGEKFPFAGSKEISWNDLKEYLKRKGGKIIEKKEE